MALGLYVCPREFLLGFADLGPGCVRDAAKAWALTEEAQLDQWTVAETTEFLKAVSNFCAKTVAEDNDLFLFVSL